MQCCTILRWNFHIKIWYATTFMMKLSTQSTKFSWYFTCERWFLKSNLQKKPLYTNEIEEMHESAFSQKMKHFYTGCVLTFSPEKIFQWKVDFNPGLFISIQRYSWSKLTSLALFWSNKTRFAGSIGQLQEINNLPFDREFWFILSSYL